MSTFIQIQSGGGADITVVANYSALPSAALASGQFYWCENSQGTWWTPGPILGTYYPAGLYYSNGTTWEYMDTPYQATQAEVDAGTVTDKFVTPKTFNDSSQLASKVPSLRTISTNAPLSGGGDLSTDRTLSISQANTSTDGYLSATDWLTFNNKQSNIILDSHIGGSNTDNQQFSRLRNILIPANTLADGDVIQVSILTLQNITLIAKNTSLHLTPTTSTTLSASNRIAASLAATTATIQHPILREFIYWQGSLQLLQTSATGAGDDPRTSGTISTEELYTFDNTIDNYFVIAAGSGANNTYTKELKRSIIKLIKK